LLASYSNIFVILFASLKELSKFTEEITYSWKVYTKILDMIIAKIIRDLTMNFKNKEDALSRWVNRIRERRGTNKAAVALANKLARMGWALLRNETVYCPA
jgi:hypothetical protein